MKRINFNSILFKNNTRDMYIEMNQHNEPLYEDGEEVSEIEHISQDSNDVHVSDSNEVPELVSSSDDDEDEEDEYEEEIPSTHRALSIEGRPIIINANDSLVNSFYTYFQNIAQDVEPSYHFSFPEQSIPEENVSSESNHGDGSSPIEPLVPANMGMMIMATINELQNQRIQREEEEQYQRDLERATQASLNEEQPIVKRIIQDGVFETFPCVVYDESVGESLGYTTCPIDFEDFEEGQLLKELPCGHCFSYNAIHKWLTTESATCPVCRKEIESKEIVIRRGISSHDESNTGNDLDEIPELMSSSEEEYEEDYDSGIDSM